MYLPFTFNFQKFSPSTRYVFSCAEKVARYYNQKILYPEHFLAAFAISNTVAGDVLREYGLTYEKLEPYLLAYHKQVGLANRLNNSTLNPLARTASLSVIPSTSLQLSFSSYVILRRCYIYTSTLRDSITPELVLITFLLYDFGGIQFIRKGTKFKTRRALFKLRYHYWSDQLNYHRLFIQRNILRIWVGQGNKVMPRYINLIRSMPPEECRLSPSQFLRIRKRDFVLDSAIWHYISWKKGIQLCQSQPRFVFNQCLRMFVFSLTSIAQSELQNVKRFSRQMANFGSYFSFQVALRVAKLMKK